MYYLLANNKIINDGDFIFKSMGFTYTSNNSIIETLIDVDSKIEYLTCREPGCDVAHIGGRVVKSSPHLLEFVRFDGRMPDLIEYDASNRYDDEYHGKDIAMVKEDYIDNYRLSYVHDSNISGFRLLTGEVVYNEDIKAIYKYDYNNKAYLRYEVSKGE